MLRDGSDESESRVSQGTVPCTGAPVSIQRVLSLFTHAPLAAIADWATVRAAELRGWVGNCDRFLRGLYILHHGKLTAVGGRFFCARHLENVVFDLGGLPLRP